MRSVTTMSLDYKNPHTSAKKKMNKETNKNNRNRKSKTKQK